MWVTGMARASQSTASNMVVAVLCGDKTYGLCMRCTTLTDPVPLPGAPLALCPGAVWVAEELHGKPQALLGQSAPANATRTGGSNVSKPFM